MTPTARGATLNTIPVRLYGGMSGAFLGLNENSPVVELVWHTALLTWVSLDVYNVTNLVWSEVGFKVDWTVL